MSPLVTRCPACATAFRAQPGQLSARKGMVRCGKCATVFDGVANLVEEGDGLPGEPSPQLGLFEAGPPATTGPGRGRALDDDEPLPEFLEEAPPRARFNIAWGLGTLLALALFAAQLAHHYRTELATLLPQTRAFLAEGCRFLDCELRLPRRPDLLSIESSDLQADKRRDSLIVLNAVIRNRAPFAQEHPLLELTLTDALDKPLLRRVLRPEDYLARPAEALAGGIAAGGESVLRVHFDTGGLRATGYRVYLFYPA